MAGDFDLCGALRRIRRRADLSQRELAVACGVAASVIAHAETGRRGLPVELLSRAAALADLRLALLDADRTEIQPMAAGTVRDRANRRYPAHLDLRYGDQYWWAYWDRYTLEQPWYTFDRRRERRDWFREHWGTPDDHLLPGPDDSPVGRRARRVEEARRRARDEYERRPAAGGTQEPVEWVCTCPPLCEELDDRSGKPVHADDCACGCDVA